MSYEPIEFEYTVHNDALWPETAYLLPSGLPWGTRLEIAPADAVIAPNTSAVFRCSLTLDDQIVRPGCSNDQGFLLTAWRVAQDADEKWGSCFYFVRPRLKTGLALTHSYWQDRRLVVVGSWRVTSDEPFDVMRNPPGGVRMRITYAGSHTRPLWRTTTIEPGGVFRIELADANADVDSAYAEVQAFYDRTALYGSSVSDQRQIKREVTVVVE